jgi:hypothetical protein
MTQSEVTRAWTPTSPQGAVSVFGGNLGAVTARDVAVDSSGNVYTTGFFRGTVDFDPGVGIANLTTEKLDEDNVFVSKLDASGNFVWAKHFRGASYVTSWSVAVDSSGNVYTTGSFYGTVDFDPGVGTTNLTAASLGDVFVSKLDASGNNVWAKQFGGTGGWGQGVSVAVDSSGNVYTSGRFSGLVDFDPGVGVANLQERGNPDGFVSKLDASGNYVWAKQFTSTTYGTYVASVAVDSSGNVYTAGTFRGTTDFDPSVGTANLTSANNEDVFVSKLDASGNYVWAKQLGGTDYPQIGNSVAVDSSGNVYTTGWFSGTADFDPGVGTENLTSAGGRDVFVSKLDTSGNYVWAKQLGATSNDEAQSVAVDSSRNVYTTGTFNSAFFVSKLDSSGNLVWTKQLGGGAFASWSVAVDSSRNVYTTGDFLDTVDFDPGDGTANLTAAGSIDVFVLMLDASGNLRMPAPGPPTSVNATTAADAQSVVSWTAPTSSGDATITGYTVTSSPDSRTCAWTTGALSCTVTGLTNGTSYTFSVTATSASGTGIASNASNSVTPSTTPGAPTNVTATNAANAQSVVSWTAPGSNGGATITGYTVTSSPDSRTCVSTTGALSCTVTGLTNGRSYTFSVTATNARGAGSASNASNSVTPSTTPGAPTNVTATNAANAQSVVSWTAPASNGDATITGYTVTASPGGRTCAWTTGDLSCTVTGLTNGTNYTFSVTATNASGTGSASEVSSSVTPIAPQSINFVSVGTQLLGKKTVDLLAIASSNLAVSYTSETPKVCTVAGSKVKMLKLGDCTVNANQSGGSGWDAAPQVSQTFTILLSPEDGEPGLSIENGDPYTNSKQVTLNLVWPEYATGVRISNDGGFAKAKTKTIDLAASVDWVLDDSVKGIYTKVVYVRFNGVADTTKTYTDDIILDTTAPTIEETSAVVASPLVNVSLKAIDDITGVDKVQVRKDTKTVTKNYATKVSVPLADLSLSVSSSGLQKLAATSVEIRVSDNAGNWTGWRTVTVAGAKTNSAVKAPTVTLNKSATAKSIASFAKLTIAAGSVTSLKVLSKSSKLCKVYVSTLKGLKEGSCTVTVTVKPKTGRSTSRTVTLKVTK